jgi:hypothetical protein
MQDLSVILGLRDFGSDGILELRDFVFARL